MIKRLFNKIPVSDKIKTDTIWNILALGLFGISALVVAFIISKYYPPEILGIFNINFALLIILSQMASGGIHYSVLYRLSKNLSAEQNRIIFTNGLTAGIIVAFIATLIIFLLKDYFSILFDSASDTEFIIFIIPAIFLLAVNKILLAYCNAKRKMKLFALANVIRSFILLISIIIFIIYEFNPKAVAGIFTLSELVVFIIYFILSQNSFKWKLIYQKGIAEHLRHGIKILAGTIFLNINTKVDIVMLGIFLSDYSVGVYTLPALIIEGFHQLPSVLRNVINPVLTEAYESRVKAEFSEQVKKGVKLTYKMLIPVGILLFILFIMSIEVLDLPSNYNEGLIPLAFLLTGSILSIGYFPLITLFNQLGYPKVQSYFFISVFLSNVIFNLLFIPIFGIIGAAIGTALSFITTVLFLKFLALLKIGIKI